ncbi:MAG: hypothetical protein QOH47_638 [Sphingomonadales bacterium]|nr:hypothetical protein [Sphingomonadales bacterium]
MNDRPSRRQGRLGLGFAAVAALAAVALTAFFFHYLTHIPIVSSPGAPQGLGAPAGRELLLDGLAAGPVFDLNIIDAERIDLRFANGVSLTRPTAQELRTFPPSSDPADPSLGNDQILRFSPLEGGNATFEFSVEGDRPGLLFTPVEPIGREQRFGVRARRGALIVEASLFGPEGAERPGETALITAHSARQVDRLTFRLPAGAMVYFRVLELGGHARAARDGDRGDPEGAMGPIIGLPIPAPNELQPSRLAVGAVATGQSDGERFAADTIVCAAPEGRTKLWRSPLPAIELDRCRPGGLLIEGLNPFARSSQLTWVAGPAFMTGDDHLWEGPTKLLGGNFIISLLAGSLFGPFVAWAGAMAKRGWRAATAPAGAETAARSGRKGRRPTKR